MSNDNLFLRATREKFRFESRAGSLTVEQVWDLPLSSKNGMDLDTVAKTVNAELRAASEESFVGPATTPARSALEAKLEVVKAIIAVKLDEKKRAEEAVTKAERRRKITEALAASEARELSGASKEDLLKMLAELDA